MTLTLISGHIRNGAIEITLSAPGLREGPVDFAFTHADGQRIVSANWPADFTRLEETDASRIALTAPDAPFSEVQVSIDGTKVDGGERWSLKGLFAFSGPHFEKHLYRHRNRIQDPETLVFSTRQLLDHYRLNPAHRCVTAVIYGYRAADSCEVAFMQDARNRLIAEIAETAKLGITGDARSDRDHLHLSMTMVLWHLELELGLFDEMIATLDKSIAYANAIPAPMAATAYNMCRMAFLRGWLHCKAGEVEAADAIFMQNFRFYVKTMERAEPSAIRFTEMLQAHEAVALSLVTREKMLTNKRNTDTTKALACANRVRSPAGTELLSRQFQRLAKRRNVAVAAGT